MTAKTGRVHVRVSKFLEGESIEEGAVARLILGTKRHRAGSARGGAPHRGGPGRRLGLPP